MDEGGLEVGGVRVAIPRGTPIEGLAFGEAFFHPGEVRYYLYALEEGLS